MAIRFVCDGCGADAATPRRQLQMWVGENGARRVDLCARCFAAVEDVLEPMALEVRDGTGQRVEGHRVHR